MPARLRDAWKLRKRLRGPGGPFRQAATLLRELMERSLRNRITSAMMVLTAAVIVLLMAISLVFMNLLLVQNITKSLAAQAAIHTHKIESALNSIADDIANLSSNMLLTSALVDSSGRDIYLDPFFKSYKVRDQLPITVALCDYLGNPLKTTGTDAEPLHLLPSVVEKVVESGTPHAEVLTAGSKTLLLMVYPVYFPSTKKPEGVVAAEVPLDDVFDKYLGSGKHDSQDIIRVAQAGTVIWSLMNRKAGKQFTATQSALLREPLHTLSLKITIGSYRKVPTLALAGVYTVAGACFLFLSFWIARIISVRVTSRLQALSKATKKIAESLAFEYIENTGEKDEVGTLTASFNRMTEVIIGMTQTLEKKVEERTAQLSEANTRLSREIAERKSTEEALREREGKIQAILRTTVDAIITITESNIIETFNPAAERIFGYSAGEVIGKNVKILMPEPDRSLHDEYVARYLRTGEKKLIGIGKELVGLRKDGEIFQMELAVSEVAIGDRRIFTGLIRDITERKKAEEALRKSEEQVRLLLESTAEAIYGIDLQGNCTFANPACIRMLGYGGPDALVGKNLHELIHHSHPVRGRIPQEECAIYRAFREGEGTHRDDEFFWRADGEAFPVEYWAYPQIQNGVVSGAVVAFLDITERKKAELAIIKSRELAEAAARSKSEFLASMSHEIRTPMNAIIGMADLLLDSPLLEEQRKYVTVFRSAGETLLHIINDILDLSKIEAGQTRLQSVPFSLPEMFKGIVEIMTFKASERKVTLSYAIGREVPDRVVGDPDRLRQILFNLVGNALKFTEAGSVHIAVRTAEHTAADPAAHDAVCLLFAVRDTGIGISREMIEKIFDKFTQADSSVSRKFGGTGLGLAISKQLVSLMKGRIWVESAPGKGSTFSFSVCLKKDTPPASAETKKRAPQKAPGAAPGEESRPLRILLVEDNEDNRLLILSYLKRFPHSVDIAQDGEEAVGKAAENAPYDLILMDVQMPVMDGYTATKLIRNRERNTGSKPAVILALTAHALQEDELKSIEAGCDGHLTKPIKKQAFLSALEEFGSRVVRD